MADKERIRQVEVYRINGRLVVANSIDGAVGTWRAWMHPSQPDIDTIERVHNSEQHSSNAALLHDSINGHDTCSAENVSRITEEAARLAEECARLNEENAKLKAQLDQLTSPVNSTTGAFLIVEERNRQIADEGYDAEHDRHETVSNLANAATSYLTYDSGLLNAQKVSKGYWPWGEDLYKPRDRKRNLIRAGALIAAAIDRMQAEEEGRV